MKKDVVKKTLSNGIVAYLYSDKDLKRVVASYNVKYGTLGFFDKFYYEDELKTVPPAMAHFLEHTLIETAKEGNMLIKFKEKSYETNAKTGLEYTSFYFVGIKDTWDSIRQLIKMVDDPNFDEENIEKVKNAVVEEVGMTKDNKYQQGRNANRRNAMAAYEAHHESYNILGTAETTKGITLSDVKLCYDAYYHDENKFLVIGGNFKIDEMIAHLENIYKDMPRHPNRMRKADYGDLLPIRKAYEEMQKPVANDYMIVTFKMRDECPENKFITDLYLSIYLRMKFGASTEFVTNLAHDKIIVGGLGYAYDFFEGMLTVTFSADILDEVEFKKRMKSELNTENLDEHLFELIRKNMKVNELSQMDAIYSALLRFHNSIDFTEKLYSLDILDQFTLEELKRVIGRLDWSLETTTIIRKDK